MVWVKRAVSEVLNVVCSMPGELYGVRYLVLYDVDICTACRCVIHQPSSEYAVAYFNRFLNFDPSALSMARHAKKQSARASIGLHMTPFGVSDPSWPKPFR